MKFLRTRAPRNNSRHIQITKSGLWYLLLTIVLGIVAINSGNNVIYLLESLLLSGLIYSGILSELAITRIDISVRLENATAALPCGDELKITNRSRLPFFCIQVGEWQNNTFQMMTFIPMIFGKETIIAHSTRAYAERGQQNMEGYALGTTFPFGLTRKYNIHREIFSRIVWPSRLEQNSAEKKAEANRTRSELEFVEGEIREVPDTEDAKLIHWPLTAKHGIPIGRIRRQTEIEQIVHLPETKPEELEKAIQVAAASFYRRRNPAKRLFIESEKREFRGRLTALNALAMLPKVDKH